MKVTHSVQKDPGQWGYFQDDDVTRCGLNKEAYVLGVRTDGSGWMQNEGDDGHPITCPQCLAAMSRPQLSLLGV